MAGRNWIQALRDDLEYERSTKEKYMEALVFSVSTLFDLGHEDKGREALKIADLPIGEKEGK